MVAPSTGKGAAATLASGARLAAVAAPGRVLEVTFGRRIGLDVAVAPERSVTKAFARRAGLDVAVPGIGARLGGTRALGKRGDA